MDDSRQVVIEGIAAMAVTVSEMGGTEEEAWRQVLNLLVRLGISDPAVIREAAADVSRLPQPLDESAEELARMEPIRRALGMLMPAEQLEAALRAREWLEHLAQELESG